MNKNVAIGLGLGVLELSSGIVGYEIGGKICKKLGIGRLKRIIFSIAVGHVTSKYFGDAYQFLIPIKKLEAIKRDVEDWFDKKKGPHIVKD